MRNLLQPENGAEARALKTLLGQQGIQCHVISFHDTAYNGLFQAQYGWGVIRVREEDFSRAEKIVQDWKNASPEDVPWEIDPSESDP